MTERAPNPLEYYASHGLVTMPGGHARLFEDLPSDIPALCRIVQGLLLHIHWAERYGEKLSEERRDEQQLRFVPKMLARIVELNGSSLTQERPLAKRLVGTCRDFSTLLCAILRHGGLPARARCGFATYFTPGTYEDHWICEYWNGERWVMVDAQLDEFQRKALGIDFDPVDVPSTRFLKAGEAWLLCRRGEADPAHFGILDMRGMWFIRGNLVRDFASLNKMELLPWDMWGLIEKEDRGVSNEDMKLLDDVAQLTLGSNDAFSGIRSLYDKEPRLHVPGVIRSFMREEIREIDLTSQQS